MLSLVPVAIRPVETPEEMCWRVAVAIAQGEARYGRSAAAVGEVATVDEDTARRAGTLLATAESKATIDALVVAEAVTRGGGVVLTADPDDLTRLAALTLPAT